MASGIIKYAIHCWLFDFMIVQTANKRYVKKEISTNNSNSSIKKTSSAG